MHSFLEFLVSIINHYYINGLNLFWNSFELFCLLLSSDTKYLFLSRLNHYDRGLIAVIVYYFQIWNKKKEYSISSWVISSHIGPKFNDTP